MDDGSIAAQKEGAKWFMSISKTRSRGLSRLIPSPIKEKLIRRKSTKPIIKLASSVNW